MAKRHAPARWHEVIAGFMAIMLFVTLFTAGVVIGTKNSRDRLLGNLEEAPTLNDFLSVLFCYTLTNVAMLAVLAAYIGGLGRRLKVDGNQNSVLFEDSLGVYAAAMVRGFLCYLMLIAGLLIVVTNTIVDADQGEYVRLAGLTSITAFVVGLQPERIQLLLKRIQEVRQDEPAGTEP